MGIRLRAGKLRHLAQVLIPADPTQTDSMGDPAEVYTPGAMFWCSIEPLSGRELILAQQVRADLTHKITTRYLSSLTAKVRVQWGTRIFELGPPLSTEERGFDLTVTAVEKRP